MGRYLVWTFRWCVPCMFVLAVLFAAPPIQAWEGRVVRVQDGDTVLVAPQGAPHGDIGIRLYGIDAPELEQIGGLSSRDALQQLVHPGDTVAIVPLSSDRYNRVIGLLIRDGLILNYELVRQGQAWVYPPYCKARFCRDWGHAEQAARESRSGLWQELAPIPPWDWRKHNQKK